VLSNSITLPFILSSLKVIKSFRLNTYIWVPLLNPLMFLNILLLDGFISLLLGLLI